MSKTAFITGVTGQDGSYLVELLLSKNYEVHGLIRQSTQFTQDKWGHLKNVMSKSQLNIHYGDLTDQNRISSIIRDIKPDEVYNLAAQSHVGLSFEQPMYTSEVTALGPLSLLEAIHKYSPNTKFYQASTSEMFGKVQQSPQNENTMFYPRSPYGCAKAFGHYITKNYRESYNLFACSGILFNHESPRRGETFVTRKITRAIGKILVGAQNNLYLGDISIKRDWGYAPDYVNAMWLMLQNTTPVDYVVGTGVHHDIQEFLDIAFSHAGLDYKDYVIKDPNFVRPAEVDTLLADPTKIKKDLGWSPTLTFEELVKQMVDYDIMLAKREIL